MTDYDGLYRDKFRTGDAPLDGSVSYMVTMPSTLEYLAEWISAIWAMTIEENWEQAGTVTIDEAVQASMAMMWSVKSMVGMIFSVAWETIPDNFLVCDGATYAKTDYPTLYDVLDPVFHVDADNFIVPDLSGRVAIGEKSGFSIGDTGGEETHTLTTAEMPSHGHTDTGHIHALAGEVPGLALSPGELPVDVPGSGEFTSSGSANITNTGGGGAHNNMQPYQVIRYVICAR